jgi:hypothetical protein
MRNAPNLKKDLPRIACCVTLKTDRGARGTARKIRFNLLGAE